MTVDAAPDARPLADASPDTIPCVANACTNLPDGTNCLGTTGAIVCRTNATTRCKEVVSQDSCTMREICQANMGCVCNTAVPAVAACSDVPTTLTDADNSVTICGGDDNVITCTRSATETCWAQTAEAECGSVEDGDEFLVCNDDRGMPAATQFTARCDCPTAAQAFEGACTVLNQRVCSAPVDGVSTDVLVCVDVEAGIPAGSCRIWDNGTYVDEGQNVGDNCAQDGLECDMGFLQCDCPGSAPDFSDLYVNRHSKVVKKREKRPQLVQNGSQHPAICAFESVTSALDQAHNNVQNTSRRARVILDNHNDEFGPEEPDPVLGDLTDTSRESVIYDFDEQFPWHVPSQIAIITVQHPEAGGGTATGPIVPRDHVIVVNNFLASNSDPFGFTAAVNVTDTGFISGFTLIEGGCDFTDDGVDFSGDRCAANDPPMDPQWSWPNVMVQVLDQNGFRFVPNATPLIRDEARIEKVHIHGGGGPDLATDDDEPFFEAADLIGGEFFKDEDTGKVTFEPAGDIMDDIIDLVNPDDGPSASIYIHFRDKTSSAGGNTGTWGPVTIEDAGDTLGWYNPDGEAAEFTGSFRITIVGDIDVGLMVGFDDQNFLDQGGPDELEFADTNATINEVTVSHFASSDGTGSRPALQGTQHQEPRPGRSRIGVLVDDDQDGAVPSTTGSMPCSSPGTLGAEMPCPDRVRFNGGHLWVNDTGMAVTDGFVHITTYDDPSTTGTVEAARMTIEWSTGQGLEVNDIKPSTGGFGAADESDDNGEDDLDGTVDDPHRATQVFANEIHVLLTQNRNDDWQTAIGHPDDDDLYYMDYGGFPLVEDGWGAQNQMTGNGINVTGDRDSRPLGRESGAPDEFETRPTLELLNGNIEANDNDGLAVLNTHIEDGAQVEATGTVFGGENGAEDLGNGENGIHIGTNNNFSGVPTVPPPVPTKVESGPGGSPRVTDKYGVTGLFTDCIISENAENGVLIDDDADGTEVDDNGEDDLGATGIVQIEGGIIEHNGYEADLDSIDDAIGVDENDGFGTWGDVREGHGILALGNATLETDEGSARLLVTRNGFTGLWASDGHMKLSRTDFTANGQNEVTDTEGTHGYGVGIHLLSRMTMTSCTVNQNLGAGLVVNSDGYGLDGGAFNDVGLPVEAIAAPPVGPSAKPQVVSHADDQANTVEDSAFNGNLGGFTEHTDEDVVPWPRDGVEVTRLGKLYFVNAPSRMSGNTQNGIDVAGQVPRGSGAPGGRADATYTTTQIHADGNLDGIVVSCVQTLNEPTRATPILTRHLIELDVAGNDAHDHNQVEGSDDGPNLHELRVACGYADLSAGSAFDNTENGARVHGFLNWTEGLVYDNTLNGVLVDHADTAFNQVVETDAVGGVIQTDEVLLRHNYAMGWNTTAGDFPAPIRSRFFNMHVFDNDENGYRVLSAPWVNEQLANLTCDAPAYDSTIDSDIERTRPVCEWGFEVLGTSGSIYGNDNWGVKIGDRSDTVQDRNIFAIVGETQIYLNGVAGITGDDRGGIDVAQPTTFGAYTVDESGQRVFDQAECVRNLDVTNTDEDFAIRCQCDHSAEWRPLAENGAPLPNNGGDPDDFAFDTTKGCTASTVTANNIYSNGGEGIRLFRSFQKAQGVADLRMIGANDIHHNDVTPQEQNVCLHDAPGGVQARQFSSQLLFIQPIGQMDPTAPEPPGGNPSEVCNDEEEADVSCWGPSIEDFPADAICYWSFRKLDVDADGDPVIEAGEVGTGFTKIGNPTDCARVNSTFDVDSDLSNLKPNHCVWLGAVGQCRIGWEVGGLESTLENACDSSRNRIWNYTVEPIGSQLLHRGVAAIEGAAVRARRNQVGRGGLEDFTAVDSGFGSQVDPGRICGQESTCNQYTPEETPEVDPGTVPDPPTP